MTDLFDSVWGDKSEIVIDHCVDITVPVRHLCLISCFALPRHPGRLRFSSSVLQVVYVLFPVVLDSCERTQGFGRRVTWTSDLVVPPGHQMTFKDALHVLSANLIMKIILPDWTKNLTNHSRDVHQSFIELKVGSSNL
jgi:hypothetical protein